MVLPTPSTCNWQS